MSKEKETIKEEKVGSAENTGSRVPPKEGKVDTVETKGSRYKVVITGTDIFGIKWIDNIVAIANKGGVVDKTHTIRTSFPHYAVMIVDSETPIESDKVNGIEVHEVVPSLTEEQLNALTWEAFKSVCRKHFSITGRDRSKMMSEYLKASEK